MHFGLQHPGPGTLLFQVIMEDWKGYPHRLGEGTKPGPTVSATHPGALCVSIAWGLQEP